MDAPILRRVWAKAHLLDLEDQWSGDPVSVTASGPFGRVGDFWRRKSWALLRALPHAVAVAGSALFAVLPDAWRPQRDGSGRLSVEERDEVEAMARESLDLEQRIAALSQNEGVLSRFTAFLAVGRKAALPKAEALHRVVQPVESVSGAKKPESVVQLMQVDPLCVKVGLDLLGLVDPQAGAPVLGIVTAIRQQLARELGFVLPGVRLRDNPLLGSFEYAVKVKEREVARGQIGSAYGMALGPEVALSRLKGRGATEPAFGLPCLWLEAGQREKAGELGCLVFDASQVLATVLLEVGRRFARELLGRQETQALIDGAKRSHPGLVRELIPNQLSLGEVQRVLQNLLEERVSIGELPVILRTLADNVQLTKDPETLTEFVRLALCHSIVEEYLDEDGELKAITLGRDVEETLLGAVQRTEQGSFLSLRPERGQSILAAITKQVDEVASHGRRPVLLTAPSLRFALRKLCQRSLPDLPILSTNEFRER